MTYGGGTQGVYAYDDMGRRVESIEGSTSTLYAFNGTETLSEKTSAWTDYVYAAGLKIGKVSGSTVNYYQADTLGSTRLVTDSSSNVHVLFSDSYQPFGQDKGASGNETYKFTGKPYSSSSQLQYNFQRWYDQSAGRFVSQDPLAGFSSDPQSSNLYVYPLSSLKTLLGPASEGIRE